MTFSYDPALVDDGGLNQMRFELGDCLVVEAEKSAYLCDEEICAAIATSTTFRRAKLRLVESLLHRFAYEVDTRTHEVEWKLHQRVDFWKDLYRRLKAELDAEDAAGMFGFTSRKFRPPAFVVGQHDWRTPCI